MQENCFRGTRTSSIIYQAICSRLCRHRNCLRLVIITANSIGRRPITAEAKLAYFNSLLPVHKFSQWFRAVFINHVEKSYLPHVRWFHHVSLSLVNLEKEKEKKERLFGRLESKSPCIWFLPITRYVVWQLTHKFSVCFSLFPNNYILHLFYN